MIEFRKAAMADKSWIEELVCSAGVRGAEYNFNNIFMWDRAYGPTVARIGGRLLIKVGGEKSTRYAFPVGTGELEPVVDALLEDAALRGGKLVLRGVTEEQVSELEALYPGEFETVFDENGSDYLYLAERLAGLSGKKLHAKRNHIHRFEEENDWSFEPVNEANLAECAALERLWVRENTAEKHMDYSDENDAIARMFTHFSELGMVGGLLRSSGRPVAFTVGSRLSKDTFDTHYEKAYADIQGAYQMVNREFARMLRAKYPELVYINREEDMGLENLRHAKRSYYPDIFLKKHVLTWK